MARIVAIAALLGVVALGLLTAVLTRAEGGASQHNSEIRVNLLRQDDGDVLVAVQHRSTDNSWGERQRPRLNRLPADAPTGRWLSSSALSLPSEPLSSGQFYVPRETYPTRALTLEQYLSFCADVSDLGEAVAVFLSNAAQAEPTWGQFLSAVESLVDELRSTDPPPALDAYHAALTRLAISTAQYAVLQPAEDMMDFADLAAPYSLDGPALEAAERSLDREHAQRLRDAGCIE